MSPRMSKIAEVALQYSKKLSKMITWFWIVYRILVLIASVIRPEIAGELSQTNTGVDTAMLVNEGTYLINSLGEKVIYSDRFVMQWIQKGGWHSLVAKAAQKLTDDNSDVEDFGDNG